MNADEIDSPAERVLGAVFEAANTLVAGGRWGAPPTLFDARPRSAEMSLRTPDLAGQADNRMENDLNQFPVFAILRWSWPQEKSPLKPV